jgi:hypothetical protein
MANTKTQNKRNSMKRTESNWKQEIEISQRTDEWLKDNPEVGELCRNGERIFYVIRDQEKVEIERCSSVLFANLEDDFFLNQ